MPGEALYDFALHGTADVAVLPHVHELFEDISPTIPARDLMLFETAVIEVINNLIEHGRPRPLEFDLRIHVSTDRVTGVIDERGQTWPQAFATDMPDIDSESGRGLPLIRAVLDSFSFERIADHNFWRLSRSLAS